MRRLPAPVFGGAGSVSVAAVAPVPVVSSAAAGNRRRRRRRLERGEGKEVGGGWGMRASDIGGVGGPAATPAPGPSPQRHRLPLLPLPAPPPGIGGGSSVSNIYLTKRSTWYPLSWLSGSTFCPLWTRYWVRYLEVLLFVSDSLILLYPCLISYFFLILS
jgi:hypothetical protein